MRRSPPIYHHFTPFTTTGATATTLLCCSMDSVTGGQFTYELTNAIAAALPQ